MAPITALDRTFYITPVCTGNPHGVIVLEEPVEAFDLYRYGPVYDERFVEKFFMYGHMTPSGYILTAQLIDSYIDYIVRHNPEDFKTAGFIGTDIPC